MNDQPILRLNMNNSNKVKLAVQDKQLTQEKNIVIATNQNKLVNNALPMKDKKENPIDTLVLKDSKKNKEGSALSNPLDKKQISSMKYKLYMERLSILKKAYPKCFSKDINRPLAKGIFHEIIKNEKLKLTKTEVRKFLKSYCNNKHYKSFLVEGAIRINLDGSNASIVTAEEIAFLNKD